MPNIDIQMGSATEEQKKQMIERLTKDASEITNIPQDKFVVFIHEFPVENIGVGGKTVKELRALAK